MVNPQLEPVRPLVDEPAPPAPRAAPSRCYLCKSDRLSIRFHGRGMIADGPSGAEAYRCTSFGHRAHPPIWECESCGFFFQWPMRSQSELLDAYRGVEDPVYVEEKENRYLTFQKVMPLLGEGHGQTLLDVGAYCGYFLDVARRHGYRVEGLELSAWASAQARSLGLTIHSQTLEERTRHPERYDVITLWDVIEHFSDPRAELEAAHKLLKPGGRIFVSTIDAGSMVARLLGGQWPWLMDMHLYYFNRANLPLLMEQVGFSVTLKRDYTHIVSADYLLRKVGASFQPLHAPVSLLRRVVPSSWPIPVNLGDNMLVGGIRKPD